MMNETNRDDNLQGAPENETPVGELFSKKASVIDMGETFGDAGDALRGDLVKIEGERRTRISNLKRQVIMLSVLLLAVLIFIPVYYFIIVPLTAPAEDEGPTIELVWASEQDKREGKCESVIGDRIMMFSQVSSANLERIDVHNAHGDFCFYRNGDGFDVLGAEGIGYYSSAFSTLVTYTGYPLSLVRVQTDADEEKMREYGLDEASCTMWYTLTTTEGVRHTVYVGDMITTGGGYYARYEGRDAVYVLSAGIGECLSASINEYIVPSIATATDSASFYNVSTFMIENEHREIYLRIDSPILQSGATGGDSGAGTGNEQTFFEMTVPTKYAVNTQTYIEILQKFVSPMGNEIVAFRLNDELVRQYGFSSPWRTLYYKFGDEENVIHFAKNPDDPSVYYAMSTKYDLIATVNAADYEFLNWDVTQYVDRILVSHYITSLSSVKIESQSVNAVFNIDVSVNDEGTPSLDYVSQGAAAHRIDVANFRKFYRYLVSLELEDVVLGLDPDTLECELALTITLRNGEEKVYRFYPYSSRRCLYTVNGEGEFYILRDSVRKIISDTYLVMNNIEVDYTARY